MIRKESRLSAARKRVAVVGVGTMGSQTAWRLAARGGRGRRLRERARNAMTAAVTRSGHDMLGDRDVPAEAYWGVHTLRATENFPITGTPICAYPHLIDALAAVKEMRISCPPPRY